MAGKRFELRVAGECSERIRLAFAGMEIASVGPQTMIYGEVRDQEELHGLFAMCQSLGLQLRSLTSSPIPGVPADKEPPNAEEAAALRPSGPYLRWWSTGRAPAR